MRTISFIAACSIAVTLCATAFAQPTKVLFFEAALAPADMISSGEPAGYSKLLDLLRSEGMLVASMSAGEITREKLSPYQLVVLHCSPERPLHNKEISALVWFVAQEGGTLFVHGGASRIVNPLTEIFGISVETSSLLDPSSAMQDDSSGRTFVLTSFPKNGGFHIDAAKSVGFYGGSALVLSQDAAAIVQGDEDCYSDDGFYSIGSFPPVAAVTYLGPGVVLVKSDRAMINNQNIDQLENRQWAKAVFLKLASAHESSIERDQSLLGLRSRISDLERILQNSIERIKKQENDLTLGYQRMKELQASLQEAHANIETLKTQLNTEKTERSRLRQALSRYQSSTVRKWAAVIVAAVVFVFFILGLMVGRRTVRSRV